MYKCIIGFDVNVSDSQGYPIEDAGFTVPKGSIWQLTGKATFLKGAEIHLECGNKWVEICQDVLEDYFIEL